MFHLGGSECGSSHENNFFTTEKKSVRIQAFLLTQNLPDFVIQAGATNMEEITFHYIILKGLLEIFSTMYAAMADPEFANAIPIRGTHLDILEWG